MSGLTIEEIKDISRDYYDAEETINDLQNKNIQLQTKVEVLEAQLENAEGYLWDASDESQWEDYTQSHIHHPKSRYTKEGVSDLERAKKYLDMIPEELRGNPNNLVQLLAAMVSKVEKLEGLCAITGVIEREKKYIELQTKVERLEITVKDLVGVAQDSSYGRHYLRTHYPTLKQKDE